VGGWGVGGGRWGAEGLVASLLRLLCPCRDRESARAQCFLLLHLIALKDCPTTHCCAQNPASSALTSAHSQLCEPNVRHRPLPPSVLPLRVCRVAESDAYHKRCGGRQGVFSGRGALADYAAERWIVGAGGVGPAVLERGVVF